MRAGAQTSRNDNNVVEEHVGFVARGSEFSTVQASDVSHGWAIEWSPTSSAEHGHAFRWKPKGSRSELCRDVGAPSLALPAAIEQPLVFDSHFTFAHPSRTDFAASHDMHALALSFRTYVQEHVLSKSVRHHRAKLASEAAGAQAMTRDPPWRSATPPSRHRCCWRRWPGQDAAPTALPGRCLRWKCCTVAPSCCKPQTGIDHHPSCRQQLRTLALT